ncbi:PadR family transcriptional regulator [Lacrimispora sp.]|uniref:PadR family transcriptional regulator n=1 Tax=Lacrimispora sp. TaxID=2719234 RepID=UPI002F41DC2D
MISDKETYGYEISEKLREYGFSDISEGTIYPLLLRLEKNGLVTVTYRESPVGPKRKYFSLSQTGREEMDSFYSSWIELENAVNRLFQDGGN